MPVLDKLRARSLVTLFLVVYAVALLGCMLIVLTLTADADRMGLGCTLSILGVLATSAVATEIELRLEQLEP